MKTDPEVLALAETITGVDDPYGDVMNNPYEFLRGFRDAEAGLRRNVRGLTLDRANAYDLGRKEFKESNHDTTD